MKNIYPTGALNEKLARLLVFPNSKQRTKQYIRKCRLVLSQLINTYLVLENKNWWFENVD